MFKSWEKIVSKHNELEKMMIEKNKLSNNRITEWNTKMAPLLRKEDALREKLLTCTTRERENLENEIDTIVDEIKMLDETLNKILKKEDEVTDRIYKYMKEHLTEKELTKAKKHGWQV